MGGLRGDGIMRVGGVAATHVTHLLLECRRLVHRKTLAAAPRPAHVVDRRRPVDGQPRLRRCKRGCKRGCKAR